MFSYATVKKFDGSCPETGARQAKPHSSVELWNTHFHWTFTTLVISCRLELLHNIWDVNVLQS
jgi:hypothetical protein